MEEREFTNASHLQSLNAERCRHRGDRSKNYWPRMNPVDAGMAVLFARMTEVANRNAFVGRGIERGAIRFSQAPCALLGRPTSLVSFLLSRSSYSLALSP